MQSREVNDITYLLPESVADVQTLVTQARQQKKQIRVRGAYHSVAAAVDPTTQAEAANGIYVLLSYLNKVSINSTAQSVSVEAGCHLGYDPLDPTGISTWENSLFAQLDQAGFAVPDMGGIIHQTVGGFLSTGSAGGSTHRIRPPTGGNRVRRPPGSEPWELRISPTGRPCRRSSASTPA